MVVTRLPGCCVLVCHSPHPFGRRKLISRSLNAWREEARLRINSRGRKAADMKLHAVSKEIIGESPCLVVRERVLCRRIMMLFMLLLLLLLLWLWRIACSAHVEYVQLLLSNCFLFRLLRRVLQTLAFGVILGFRWKAVCPSPFPSYFFGREPSDYCKAAPLKSPYSCSGQRRRYSPETYSIDVAGGKLD